MEAADVEVAKDLLEAILSGNAEGPSPAEQQDEEEQEAPAGQRCACRGALSPPLEPACAPSMHKAEALHSVIALLYPAVQLLRQALQQSCRTVLG